jgi:hypothetical protein
VEVSTQVSTSGTVSASGVVRRWVVFAILFTLVTLAANGTGNLLSYLIDTDPNKGEYTYSLANWLAYTFIAGPIAVLLWWFAWRKLADNEDRSSYAWPIYLAVMYTTSLTIFAVSLLGMISDFITGSGRPLLAIGMIVSWGVIWLWHRWMLLHRAKSPLRLANLPLVLGFIWGLALAAINGVRMLNLLFEQVFSGMSRLQFGASWWTQLLGALAWTLGGLIIWWWHWHHHKVREQRGGFADVAVLVFGVFAAASAALIAVGSLLSLGMRWVWDPRLSGSDLVSMGSFALATFAVAAPIWLYHRHLAQSRAEQTSKAVRLIESGLGIVAMSAGLGVVVNASLASIGTPLAGAAGGGAITLLLQGIAAMVVGGAVWFWAWQPQRLNQNLGDPARRVYLVAIFGVGAVAALGALITIGFRVFELMLSGSGNVLENIRTPLGILVATTLVFGYHFAIWRRDRALTPSEDRPEHRIGHLTFVGAVADPQFAQAVAQATGAKVAVWARADGASPVATDAVLAALTEISAPRVLLVAGANGNLEVIPLA